MRALRVAGFAERNALTSPIPVTRVGNQAHGNVAAPVDGLFAPILWEGRNGELGSQHRSLGKRVRETHRVQGSPRPLSFMIAKFFPQLFDRILVTGKQQSLVRIKFFGQPFLRPAGDYLVRKSFTTGPLVS